MLMKDHRRSDMGGLRTALPVADCGHSFSSISVKHKAQASPHTELFQIK